MLKVKVAELFKTRQLVSMAPARLASLAATLVVVASARVPVDGASGAARRISLLRSSCCLLGLLACLLYHTRNTEDVARTDTLN